MVVSRKERFLLARQITVTKTCTRRIVYSAIIGAFLVFVIVLVPTPKQQKTHLLLSKNEIEVTIADTLELRERGLSYRERLASNEGMLFVFQEPKPYGFWMKDMNFPIDIIWFDANRRIVWVKERADPLSYPEIFTPSADALFVLEVPAGFFSEHHLHIGDLFEILQ